jgi:hypothetical protein
MKRQLLISLGVIVLIAVMVCSGHAVDGGIPSGYFQLPIWLIVLLWSSITGFVVYIWRSLEGRVKANELYRQKKLEEGRALTIEQHNTICNDHWQLMKKEIKELLDNQTKYLEILIENKLLKGNKKGKK